MGNNEEFFTYFRLSLEGEIRYFTLFCDILTSFSKHIVSSIATAMVFTGGFHPQHHGGYIYDTDSLSV